MNHAFMEEIISHAAIKSNSFDSREIDKFTSINFQLHWCCLHS